MILPAYAEPLSDRTGLKTSFPIVVESGTYNVEVTANFDVRDVSFQENDLVFTINSSLENNLGEIQIPNGITTGNLTFSLDGQNITPKVLHNDRISFVTLEFAGNGTHSLSISSDYVTEPIVGNTLADPVTTVDHSNDMLIIIAVIGIVVAGGAGTTAAVYFKRKKA